VQIEAIEHSKGNAQFATSRRQNGYTSFNKPRDNNFMKMCSTQNDPHFVVGGSKCWQQRSQVPHVQASPRPKAAGKTTANRIVSSESLT
jgi:hypothetical protein